MEFKYLFTGKTFELQAFKTKLSLMPGCFSDERLDTKTFTSEPLSKWLIEYGISLDKVDVYWVNLAAIQVDGAIIDEGYILTFPDTNVPIVDTVFGTSTEILLDTLLSNYGTSLKTKFLSLDTTTFSELSKFSTDDGENKLTLFRVESMHGDNFIVENGGTHYSLNLKDTARLRLGGGMIAQLKKNASIGYIETTKEQGFYLVGDTLGLYCENKDPDNVRMFKARVVGDSFIPCNITERGSIEQGKVKDNVLRCFCF